LKLIAKIASIFIPIAIIVCATVVTLVPYITNPPPSPILLNRTVTLTDENYDVGYSLILRKGERIEVKASGNGQPIDFRIADNQSSTLVQETGNIFYDLPWTAPADGAYIFYVSAASGDVKATVIVVEA
jgi:hypothetical protein